MPLRGKGVPQAPANLASPLYLSLALEPPPSQRGISCHPARSLMTHWVCISVCSDSLFCWGLFMFSIFFCFAKKTGCLKKACGPQRKHASTLLDTTFSLSSLPTSVSFVNYPGSKIFARIARTSARSPSSDSPCSLIWC